MTWVADGSGGIWRFWKYIWKLEFEPNYRSLEVFGRFWARYSESFVGFGFWKVRRVLESPQAILGSGGLQKTLRTPGIWKVRVVSMGCGLAVGDTTWAHSFMSDKQPLVLAGPNETVWSAQQKKSDTKDLLITIPCRCSHRLLCRKVVQLFIFPFTVFGRFEQKVVGCHRFWKGTIFIFLGWVLLFKRSHAYLSMHGPTLCEVGIYCPFFRREEGWQGVVRQVSGRPFSRPQMAKKQTIVFNSSMYRTHAPFWIYVCNTIVIHMRSAGKHTSLVPVVKWQSESSVPTLKTLKFAEFASTFQRYPSIQYPICNLKLDLKARHSRLVVVGAVP